MYDFSFDNILKYLIIILVSSLVILSIFDLYLFIKLIIYKYENGIVLSSKFFRLL